MEAYSIGARRITVPTTVTITGIDPAIHRAKLA
jgi:hypothetical protein